MSIFSKFFSWLKGAAKSTEHAAAKVAVFITELLKTAATNGTLDVAGYIVDAISKSDIGDVAVAKLKVVIPNTVSLALALESPDNNATAEQMAEWSQNVLKAIGLASDRSKLYTTLAADIAKDIQNHLSEEGAGKGLSFADWVQIVEDAFQDYQKHTEVPEQGSIGGEIGSPATGTVAE